VFEHFEDFYFAHRGFFDDFVFLGLLKLFDGDDLLVLVAAALEDDAVGSLADQS
jgi:hypothetical protein